MSYDSHTVRLFQLHSFEISFTLVLYRRPHSPKPFLLRVHPNSAWTEARSMNLVSSTKELEKRHVLTLCRDRKEKDYVIFYNFTVFPQPVFVSTLFRANSAACTYSTTCAAAPPELVPFSTPKDVIILWGHNQPL